MEAINDFRPLLLVAQDELSTVYLKSIRRPFTAKCDMQTWSTNCYGRCAHPSFCYHQEERCYILPKLGTVCCLLAGAGGVANLPGHAPPSLALRYLCLDTGKSHVPWPAVDSRVQPSAALLHRQMARSYTDKCYTLSIQAPAEPVCAMAHIIRGGVEQHPFASEWVGWWLEVTLVQLLLLFVPSGLQFKQLPVTSTLLATRALSSMCSVLRALSGLQFKRLPLSDRLSALPLMYAGSAFMPFPNHIFPGSPRNHHWQMLIRVSAQPLRNFSGTCTYAMQYMNSI